MIRHFCDCCGAELTDANNVRTLFKKLHYSNLKGKHGDIEFEVRTGEPPTEKSDGKDGEWCKYCVIDAVKSLDDRPIAASPALMPSLHVANPLNPKNP